MTATAQMITQIRRWTKEPTTTPYSDAAITALIEAYPLVDERGVAPYYYDTTTDPPTQVATTGWYPRYDLHMAASVIWEDKWALLASEADQSTQGPSPTTQRRTQPRDEALRQARYHRSRSAGKTVTQIAWPSRRQHGDSWIANLAEEP